MRKQDVRAERGYLREGKPGGERNRWMRGEIKKNVVVGDSIIRGTMDWLEDGYSGIQHLPSKHNRHNEESLQLQVGEKRSHTRRREWAGTVRDKKSCPRNRED